VTIAASAVASSALSLLAAIVAPVAMAGTLA